MYRAYYRLRRKPFDLLPDPKMVYMGEEHQEALSMLRYGVLDNKDFLLLSGEVGTGKSTLLQVLLSSIEDQHHICLLANPLITLDDLYLYMADSYGLPDFNDSRAKFLISFGKFLQGCAERDERVLLIVDEAHALSLKTLEEIRMLSNQPSCQGVFGIFLVGQPEINELLATDRLRPLRQRISLRFHLTPFNRQETDYYIRQRLLKAGGHNLDLFSPGAVDAIFQASGGTPRAINLLCDHALLAGYSNDKTKITRQIIADVLPDIILPKVMAPAPDPAEDPKASQQLQQAQKEAAKKPESGAAAPPAAIKNKEPNVFIFILIFFLGAISLYLLYSLYS
ncbi:MAG: AAA family ATPase [Thermodesulfobacteriota bacterium]